MRKKTLPMLDHHNNTQTPSTNMNNVNAGTITDVVERKNEIKINKFNSSKTYPNF
jgi:hypothetical protein